MTCAVCRKPLEMCSCPDLEERIAILKQSPFLSIDWEAIEAARFLNRHERERLAKEEKTP